MKKRKYKICPRNISLGDFVFIKFNYNSIYLPVKDIKYVAGKVIDVHHFYYPENNKRVDIILEVVKTDKPREITRHCDIKDIANGKTIKFYNTYKHFIEDNFIDLL